MILSPSATGTFGVARGMPSSLSSRFLLKGILPFFCCGGLGVAVEQRSLAEGRWARRYGAIHPSSWVRAAVGTASQKHTSC